MKNPKGRMGTFICERRYHEWNLFSAIGRWRAWQRFSVNDVLPIIPCCYVVYYDGKIAYVGSTENLRTRWWGHGVTRPSWKNPRRTYIKAKFPRRLGEWLMLELRLIRRLRPLLNRKGVYR